MKNLGMELRQVWRFLSRNPGFAAAVVLSLVLGIGANTVMFSVVRTVFVKPLPWKDSERIVRMSLREEGDANWQNKFIPLDRAGFEAWRKGSTLYAHVAGFNGNSIGLSLTGSGTAEHFNGQAVSSNFFELLGIAPVIGRTFLQEEDQPGRANVAVLSYAAWNGHFGGDSATVGRTLMLNGQEYTVIGVMPAGFKTPEWPFQQVKHADIWIPMDPTRDLGGRFIIAFGKVRPGVTPQQAESEASAIISGLYPEWLCNAKPLTSDYDNVKPQMTLLFGATILVLLVACANVANMTLTRSTARIRESGIRAALGAGEMQIVRQFILESVMFSVMAGLVALLFAQAIMAFLRRLQPASLPRADELYFDWSVFGFALLLAIVVAVVIGFLPALQMARTEIIAMLGMGGTRTGERGFVLRSREILIVVQAALSVILLVGAGLLTRSLLELSYVDLGFDARNVLLFKIKTPEQWTFDKIQNFHVRMRERIDTVAGVEIAGYGIWGAPLEGTGSLNVIMEDSRTEPNRPTLASFRQVSLGYFRAMGIPILQGEDISERQSEASNRDVIINEAFARQHWPGEDPLGRAVYLNSISESNRGRVVGVVKNVKETHIAANDFPEIYIPYSGNSMETTVCVRTVDDPMKFAAEIRRVVAAVDPDVAPYDMRKMEQVVATALAAQKFQAGLLGLFAVIATALAAVGIYGVVSYAAGLRTQEIGIRIALGATRWSILRVLAGRYMVVTAMGLAIGVVGSSFLTRLIQHFLYRVEPYDAWTLTGVTVLFLLTAGVAAWIPSHRAASTDLMRALKCE